MMEELSSLELISSFIKLDEIDASLDLRFLNRAI